MDPAQVKSHFLLRLDADVYKRLAQLSKNQNLSINTLCSQFIQEGLDEGGQNNKLISTIIKRAQAKDLHAIVLFGSQSRGEASATSDIDLLLVFDRDTKISRSLYRKFETLLEPLPEFERYSIHCVSLPENITQVSGFWFEIALDGKILWKRNSDINRWLSNVKNSICSGQYVRKLSSGQPYWIKNEK